MKQRVISAVILLAIVLSCVFLSYVTRVLFFGVAGILCAYEYSRGLEKIDVYCAAWVMYVYIAVQAVLALIHAGAVSYIACFTGGIFLAMFSGIVHHKVSGHGAIYTVAGLAYPGVVFGVLMMISVGTIWKEALVLGAISCWSCDSFALFGGLRFGKHKLAPNVSPNKSIEGSICGGDAGKPDTALLYLDQCEHVKVQGLTLKAEGDLLNVGIKALRTISLCFPLAAIGIITGTLFQATGRGVYSLLTSLLRQLIIIVPAAYILSKISGVMGVWYAFPLAEGFSLVFSLLMFRRLWRTDLSKIPE